MTTARLLQMAAAGAGASFFPYFWEIVPIVLDANTGVSTWSIWQASAIYTGGRYYSSEASADDGDTYSWFLPMAAGTWTITVTWHSDSSKGMFDVTLGGSTLATAWDQYAASSSSNQATSWTGATVSNDGIYELKFTTNGKNASSSDYVLSLQSISAWRTGA